MGNITTLNMTTLDGGVIIKKGEGGGAIINNLDKVVDITENGTTEVVADSGFTGLGKVTINTEVSTVNNQDKTVDIEENGTIEVTPDEGFTGLGKVTVNTNVESASTIEYLDVSGIDVPPEIPMLLGGLAKFTQTKYNSEELDYKGIVDSFTMMKYSGYDGVMKITALAIQTGILDLPIKVTYLPTGKVTDEGVTKDVLDAGLGGLVTTVLNCPRITKEQFYDLD